MRLPCQAMGCINPELSSDIFLHHDWTRLTICFEKRVVFSNTGGPVCRNWRAYDGRAWESALCSGAGFVCNEFEPMNYPVCFMRQGGIQQQAGQTREIANMSELPPIAYMPTFEENESLRLKRRKT